jgi:S1-C subfamily serine protease
VAAVKRSVVAVGTYMALRANRHEPRGTGFAVAPNLAVTNSHVLPERLDADRKETYALFLPAGGERMEVREATLVRRDSEHDLALLRYRGPALPALRLGRGEEVREGQSIAFTGFPLVGALGLHAATHRGIVSAIAPVAIPAGSGAELKPELLSRLGRPFDIFQLDAVAYPGNSGSPVFEVESGRVLAVLNSVFVKGTKELALSAPSGIGYAIPVDHVRALLAGAGVKQ